MESISEPKQSEEKKTWIPPVVEDYDLVSSTGSGLTGSGQDNVVYS